MVKAAMIRAFVLSQRRKAIKKASPSESNSETAPF
jgi:hypothetical protein